MHRIWPPEESGPVDEQYVERLYRYPDDHPKWLAVNFVCSADGAVEIAGRSAGLTNPADQQVYRLGGDLADVRLVGAGTAMIEEFRGIRPTESTVRQRRRHGLADVPPVAVVTSGRSLPPDAPVITDVLTPTIVITCAAAREELREAWTAAGASVLVAGTDTVDLAAAVDGLVECGLSRIHCDGGPQVFGAALTAGLVDELRLTMSPLLVCGPAERIAIGMRIDPSALELASVLAEDNTLMLRYLVKR
ncbi:MAG: pyrimidine reductase family protein [Pseudonocardiaceae bacterium]|nr:pyrimidine reductase family protein [Pseudonocardiaceae bacterium]